MTNKIIFIFILFPLFVFSQKTYIPDDAFEQALINFELDDFLDDSVFTEAIDTIKLLDIYNRGIVSLVGIEDFIALTELFCFNNLITELDLTNQPDLFEVNCSGNLLTSLSIKNGNPNGLWYFNATNNPDLSCVEVDDVPYAYNNWVSGLPNSAVFNVFCSPTQILEKNREISLTNVIDLFGRKVVDPFNKVLIYMYDNGTVEKKIIIK